MPDDQDRSLSFRSIATLIAVVSIAVVIGRICSAESKDRKTTFFSANDRSRWCMISALVDHGTYSIDDVIKRRGWNTIDKVRHADRDGVMRHYSSKPPLYPTLLAAKYWVVKNITGASLSQDPFYAGRLMLILSNVPLLVLYFYFLTKLVDEFAESDWTKVFVMVAAGFGTLLTPLAISLSNHLPAAVCALLTIWALVRIWKHANDPNTEEVDGRPRHSGWMFFLTGLAAAFTAANELPALSFFAVVSAVALALSPRMTLRAYLPGCAIVAAGFFATNYAAHASWKPPYAHRSVDDNWYDYPGSYWMTEKQGVDKGEPSKAVYAVNALVGHYGIYSLTPIWIFSLFGMAIWATRGATEHRAIAIGTFILMAVCLTFYILLRSQKDRNYGGVCCGFRWMFWFIPMWLMTSIPALEKVAVSRIGQGFAIICLAVSIFSASFPANNPWTSPWIYQYWQSLGWL